MKPSEWMHQLTKQFPKIVTIPKNADADTATFPCVDVSAGDIAEVLQACAVEPGLECDFLECLTGIDTGEEIEIVYQLYSLKNGHRINLRTGLPRTSPTTVSACPVWAAALSYEREIAEMFGVKFRGCPNSDHLLLPDDWQGFPLRKDYVFPEAVHSIEHRRDIARKEHVRP